jgi:hypothetical protein
MMPMRVGRSPLTNPVTAGTPIDPARICEGEAGSFILAELLTGADTGGSWTETSATPSTGGGFNAVLVRLLPLHNLLVLIPLNTGWQALHHVRMKPLPLRSKWLHRLLQMLAPTNTNL